jgi:hypothetical protein
MYTEKTELVDGLAYLEFSGVYTNDRNGVALVSKKGEPMFNLAWNATDSRGNSSKIYDFVTSSTMWKVVNIQNATGRKGFFTSGSETFNVEPLAGAFCGAAIAKDQYGPKIKMYVPMAFYKMVLDPSSVKQANPKNTVEQSGFTSPKSVPGTQIGALDDDDGIPF